MSERSPLTPAPSASYAAVAMHGSDKIRFLHFPEEIHAGAEAVLRRAWPMGIQAQQYLAGAYQYKLAGSPFGSTGGKDHKGGVGSRVLVRDLLAYLYDRGWVLNASLAQSRHLASKDTLIFRREDGPASTAPSGGPPPVDWLVVGISKGNKLRLIGDSTAGLVQALRRELERLGSFEGGEWNAEMGVDGGFEFTLKDSPWRAWRGESPVKARLLILRIIEVLDGFGWRSYGTILQRSGNDSYRKADTWYFVKSQDFVLGSPFNSEPLKTLPEGLAQRE